MVARPPHPTQSKFACVVQVMPDLFTSCNDLMTDVRAQEVLPWCNLERRGFTAFPHGPIAQRPARGLLWCAAFDLHTHRYSQQAPHSAMPYTVHHAETRVACLGTLTPLTPPPQTAIGAVPNSAAT
eukprot:6179879-Pleurochrysis_carterae.AAC.1